MCLLFNILAQQPTDIYKSDGFGKVPLGQTVNVLLHLTYVQCVGISLCSLLLNLQVLLRHVFASLFTKELLLSGLQ